MDKDIVNAENHRSRAAVLVQNICRKYGLSGNVVYYNPSPFPESDRNRLYIVAGFDPAIRNNPIASNLEPDAIVRKVKRNEKLFYPKIWAYDLFENKNDVHAQLLLADYCETASFLARLYDEYGADMPEKLRISEINQLKEYQAILDNPASAPALQDSCQKALDYFFKREKSKNTFRQKWLSYYRSEHFPDEKGFIGRIAGYFHRDDNRIRTKQLMAANGDIKKLEMQEHEYKIFVNLMQEKHPDVLFSVGDKTVVDHGLINASRESGPFGRAVTGEEFAVIRKERFATEGYAAIADLRPSYFEFRDVYYRDLDEPLVAGIYNRINLSYAKCNSLMELKQLGDLRLEKIPKTDFMNFVSLAKANGLRFYIDNDGEFSNPSLDLITVIYNGHQEGKLEGIKKRMVYDKVTHGQLMSSQHPSLAHRLNSIEPKNTSKAKGKTPESHLR